MPGMAAAASRHGNRRIDWRGSGLLGSPSQHALARAGKEREVVLKSVEQVAGPRRIALCHDSEPGSAGQPVLLILHHKAMH